MNSSVKRESLRYPDLAFPWKEKPVLCEQCDKIFVKQESLSHHIRNCHELKRNDLADKQNKTVDWDNPIEEEEKMIKLETIIINLTESLSNEKSENQREPFKAIKELSAANKHKDVQSVHSKNTLKRYQKLEEKLASVPSSEIDPFSDLQPIPEGVLVPFNHPDRTVEIVNTVQSNRRKYNLDFSSYFEHNSLEKTSLKESVEEILANNTSISNDQRKALESLYEPIKDLEEKDLPFPCTTCDKKFPLKKYMLSHVSTVHHKKGKRKTEPVMVQCPECNKSFNKSVLRDHMKGQHLGFKMQCNICPKDFNYRANLKRHIRQVHTDLKPYSCKQCVRTFSDSGNLRKHERLKHLNIRYPCPDCNRSCIDKGDLSTHRKEKHSGSAIICYFCGIDYTTFAGLKMHMNSKHAEVPTEYPCDICGVGGFLTAVDKNSHKRKAHDYKGVNSERMFSCNLCEHKFNSDNERKKHKKSEHNIVENKETFKCNICQRNFPTSIRLSVHKNKCTHSDLTCNVCDKLFTLPRTLRLHKVIHIKLK